VISLDVDTSGLDAAQRMLAAMADQLPFATSLALNRTARDVQLAYRGQTTVSFISPVAFTRNAWRYTQSTKTSLEATVGAAPGRSYLATQSTGGERRWKAYEGFIRSLTSQPPLPDRQLVPTQTAINAAGNPRKSLFAQIQRGLSTTDRGGFLVGTPRGTGRPPGVYRRSRERLIPFFIVPDDAPSYSPRFPLAQLGQATVSRAFSPHLSAAIDRAIATARRP
jgi:hypothetical protein